MYWADLSRVATGPLGFFGGLYQLLLHLAELGRQAVDDAAYEHRDSRTWRWLSNMQAYAVRLLVLPIVLLNAILLCGALAPVLVRTLSNSAALGASSVLGGIIGVVVAYALFRNAMSRGRALWIAVPLVALALGAGLGFVLGEIAGPTGLLVVAAVEWWLAAWALLHFVFRAYDRVRPGALWVGHLLYALCFGIFVWSLAMSGGDHRAIYYAGVTIAPSSIVSLGRVEQATLWTIQLVWVALRLCWFLLCFFAVATATLGIVAIRLNGKATDHAVADARRARGRAALRTGRLALALSALGFMLLTIVIWIGAFSYTAGKSDAFQCLAPSIAPLPSWLEQRVPEANQLAAWLDSPAMPADSPCPGQPSIREYFRALFVLSVSTGLVATLALTGVALLLLLWMALPSILTEGGEAKDQSNAAAKRMGAWLSRGLDSTSAATWLLWFAIFVIPPLFTYGGHMAFLPGELNSAVQEAEHLTVSTIGAIAAVTASATLLIGATLKFGGSALDVVLDVDNYLRALPGDGTPRARIAERYVSLLRRIAASGTGGDPGPRYRAVVIVAHSLGALISADLLRFLKYEAQLGAGHGDDHLTRLGYGFDGAPGDMLLYLFTMGNPLRQLMNRFFPHSYRWVRESPDNGIGPVTSTPPAPAIAANAPPSPSQLGVAAWDNAYRSGDYVGRSLWLTEWYARTLGTESTRPTLFEESGRAEECIGVGAHTHYWDRTAPEIGRRVDELVGLAASRVTTPALPPPPSLSLRR